MNEDVTNKFYLESFQLRLHGTFRISEIFLLQKFFYYTHEMQFKQNLMQGALYIRMMES